MNDWAWVASLPALLVTLVIAVDMIRFQRTLKLLRAVERAQLDWEFNIDR